MNDLPAFAGGKPVRPTLLPYGQQWIDEDDIAAVVGVLRSNYVTTGPKVNEFEQKFADYVGARYAVAVSNGTAALHAACFAAGIGPGDEVITTPMTFAASANCILYMGGQPVFADVNPETYNIDVYDIQKKITPKTKAIIPVHFTGQPCDLDGIHYLAEKYGLVVIEDAAHAIGARYKGEKIGGLSDMTIFSFHPVKHFTTGEGGMITTNNAELYELLCNFRSHGITRDHQKWQTKDPGPWYYEMQWLGYNYRLTDIQAALGISQLEKSDYFLERRRQLALAYQDAFRDVEGVRIPYQAEYSDSSWHLYILSLELDRLSADRRVIFSALRAENIGVNVHYIPVYYQPYYQELGYHRGLCPVSEALYDRIITLPLFPKMTDDDLSDVITAVKKVISYFREG